MFKKGTQNFTTSDPTYTIPVVRTRNQDSPATVKWRTKKAQRFELSGPLKFGPGETEKNIVIDPRSHPGPIQPETFQLELFDPSSNASIGERKTTLVNVTDGGETQGETIICAENMELKITWRGIWVVTFKILYDGRRDHFKHVCVCVCKCLFHPLTSSTSCSFQISRGSPDAAEGLHEPESQLP